MAYTSIFTDVINSYLPEPHASLLNGIIFGVALKSDKAFTTELKHVGLTHLVVLSGMNITILSSIISGLTYRLSKKLSILITLFSIIIFILFVGIQAPIIRAGIMGVLTLVALLTGKKTTVLYTLVVSAVISLLIWPKWLTSVSFHLSYAATLGLIIFAKKVQESESKTIPSKLKYYLKSEFTTTMAAQVFTVPLIFINFKQISLVAPLSNIAVSWVVSPLMIFGFLTAILGKIHYSLGLLPSYICYVLLSYLIFVIHLLSNIPFTFFSLQ